MKSHLGQPVSFKRRDQALPCHFVVFWKTKIPLSPALPMGRPPEEEAEAT